MNCSNIGRADEGRAIILPHGEAAHQAPLLPHAEDEFMRVPLGEQSADRQEHGAAHSRLLDVRVDELARLDVHGEPELLLCVGEAQGQADGDGAKVGHL